jgi:hypothetical protein
MCDIETMHKYIIYIYFFTLHYCQNPPEGSPLVIWTQRPTALLLELTESRQSRWQEPELLAGDWLWMPLLKSSSSEWFPRCSFHTQSHLEEALANSTRQLWGRNRNQAFSPCLFKWAQSFFPGPCLAFEKTVKDSRMNDSDRLKGYF